MTAAATTSTAPVTSALGLRRIKGEAPGEIVYMATHRTFTFWLKQEWSGAPWEWIILDGRYPFDFGHASTEDLAAQALALRIADVAPEFGKPPKGLVGHLRDLIGL
jgi:hypothetical protein